jgi:hypothetical protein
MHRCKSALQRGAYESRYVPDGCGVHSAEEDQPQTYFDILAVTLVLALFGRQPSEPGPFLRARPCLERESSPSILHDPPHDNHPEYGGPVRMPRKEKALGPKISAPKDNKEKVPPSGGADPVSGMAIR